MTLNVCEVSNDTNGITTKKYDESLNTCCTSTRIQGNGMNGIRFR